MEWNGTDITVEFPRGSDKQDDSKKFLVGVMKGMSTMLSIIVIRRTTCGVIRAEVRGIEDCGYAIL